MLTKNKSGHYINCNSQVGAQSKWAIKNTLGQIIGYHCNCTDLEKQEEDRLKNVTTPPPPRTAYGNLYMQQFYGNTFSVPMPLDDIDEFVMGFSRFSNDKSEGVKEKYQKVTSYYDLIESAIESTIRALNYIEYNKVSLHNSDTYTSIFLINYNELINLHQDTLTMPKPDIKLIKIGMDIDLRMISSTSFVVKPLKGNIFNGYTLRKDTFWVLSDSNGGKPPFSLFEFPQTHGIKPKCDLVMLIDPYTCEEDVLTETIYHQYGITIMKKFDIKDAHKLLTTRKNIFNTTPTATNTILLFQLMDAIILNDFKSGTLDLDKTGEKNLIRLEKLKNLALDTKFNEERKSAVDKSFIQFEIICSEKEDQEKVG